MIHRLLLHPADQPILSLAIRAAGSAFDVLVNDVPVFRDRDGDALNLTLPINEWLFRGTNEIRLESQVLAGNALPPELRLQYRRARQPWNLIIPLTVLTHRGRPEVGLLPEKEDDEAGVPGSTWVARVGEAADFVCTESRTGIRGTSTLMTAGTFVLPAPWMACPWSNAEVLDIETPIKKLAIWDSTRNFWLALQRRNHAAVRDLVAVRLQGLVSAYHLNETEAEEAMLFTQLLRSNDWQVAPLEQAEGQIELAGKRRLARIVHGGTGESLLRLANQGALIEAVVDVWWQCRAQSWTIVR